MPTAVCPAVVGASHSSVHDTVRTVRDAFSRIAPLLPATTVYKRELFMRRRLIVTAGFAGIQLRAASRSFSFVCTQDRKRCCCQHRGNAVVRSGRRLEFADSASVTLTAISLDQVFGSADVSRSTVGTLTSRVNSQDLRAVLAASVPCEAETPYTVGVSPVREAGARPHPGPPRLGRRSPLPPPLPPCPSWPAQTLRCCFSV